MKEAGILPDKKTRKREKDGEKKEGFFFVAVYAAVQNRNERKQKGGKRRMKEKTCREGKEEKGRE